MPTGSNAVPMWVLGVAVVAALAVGAIVSIVFQGSDEEPSVLSVERPEPRAPGVVPGVVPGAVGVTPGVPSPSPAATSPAASSPAASPAGGAPAVVPAPSPSSVASASPAPAANDAPPSPPTRPTRTAVPSSSPTAQPSPTTARPQSVDSAADAVRELSQRLMQRATTALAETSDPAKQQEISRILADMTMDVNSANPEQTLPRLKAFEKRLESLAPR